MHTLPPASLLNQLSWRYATKRFDPTRIIPAETWTALEHSLILAPSSFGLQPWKFIVISSPQVKDQLPAITWGQKQVKDASHVVVFAVRKPMLAADVHRYVERIVEVRGVTAESLAGFRKVMLDFIENPPAGLDINEWAIRQAYIALGTFMTSAAVLGIDTCPLEGIVPNKYDELLELPQQGYATVVACAAGYRAADDKYAATPKVRFKAEDLIIRL